MPKTNPFDPNMSTGKGWLLVPSGQFRGSFLWHKRWKMLEEIRMLLLKMDGWRKIIWRWLFEDYYSLYFTIYWRPSIGEGVAQSFKTMLVISWYSSRSSASTGTSPKSCVSSAGNAQDRWKWKGCDATRDPNLFLRSGVQISWKWKFRCQLFMGWGERQIIPLAIAGKGSTKHKDEKGR